MCVLKRIQTNRANGVKCIAAWTMRRFWFTTCWHHQHQNNSVQLHRLPDTVCHVVLSVPLFYYYHQLGTPIESNRSFVRSFPFDLLCFFLFYFIFHPQQCFSVHSEHISLYKLGLLGGRGLVTPRRAKNTTYFAYSPVIITYIYDCRMTIYDQNRIMKGFVTASLCMCVCVSMCVCVCICLLFGWQPRLLWTATAYAAALPNSLMIDLRDKCHI